MNRDYCTFIDMVANELSLQQKPYSICSAISHLCRDRRWSSKLSHLDFHDFMKLVDRLRAAMVEQQHQRGFVFKSSFGIYGPTYVINHLKVEGLANGYIWHPRDVGIRLSWLEQQKQLFGNKAPE